MSTPHRVPRSTVKAAKISKEELDRFVDRFVARLRGRLEAGAVTYGDASFIRPAVEIVDEVQQELEDVSGWSLILWVRLEHLRARIDAVTNGGADES